MLAQPAPRPTTEWKILQSWWILLSILGCGCLSGVGFVIIGLRARKPWWWGAGVLYMILGTTAFGLSEKLGTAEEAHGPSSLAWGGVWLVTVVHSIILNFSWLSWQEAHRDQQFAAAQQQYAAAQPQAAWGAGPVSGAPVSPGLAYGAPQQPGYPTSAVPYSPAPYSAAPYQQPAPQPYTAQFEHYAPEPAPQAYEVHTFDVPLAQPQQTGGVVDVNTADAAQLAALPGFDHGRVAYVLSERARRGGFASVEDFAATAQLTPDQLAHLRPYLIRPY